MARLNSIIMPFDAFEISCFWKYYAPFSIIFSKVFKILIKFFLMSKNRKWSHDLNIAYGVMFTVGKYDNWNFECKFQLYLASLSSYGDWFEPYL